MARSKEPKHPTREDVDKLKRDWQLDPCWDLEMTEGFEEHRAELLIYRLEMEKRWAQQRYSELRKRVVALFEALNALRVEAGL